MLRKILLQIFPIWLAFFVAAVIFHSFYANIQVFGWLVPMDVFLLLWISHLPVLVYRFTFSAALSRRRHWVSFYSYLSSLLISAPLAISVIKAVPSPVGASLLVVIISLLTAAFSVGFFFVPSKLLKIL